MPSTAHLFPAVVPTVPTAARRKRVDAALARVAKGAGRRPTSAHPFAACFGGQFHRHYPGPMTCAEHIACATGRRDWAESA